MSNYGNYVIRGVSNFCLDDFEEFLYKDGQRFTFNKAKLRAQALNERLPYNSDVYYIVERCDE